MFSFSPGRLGRSRSRGFAGRFTLNHWRGATASQTQKHFHIVLAAYWRSPYNLDERCLLTLLVHWQSRNARGLRRDQVWEYNAHAMEPVLPPALAVVSPSRWLVVFSKTRLLTSVPFPLQSFLNARPSLRLSKPDERKRRVSQPPAKLTE